MSTITSPSPGLLASQVATGTNQATALPLTSPGPSGLVFEFSSVPSGAGAILPTPIPGQSLTIVNAGSNTLAVYPPSGGKINEGTANASESLAAGSAATFVASTLTNWNLIGSGGSSSGITGLTGDVTTPAGSSGSTAAFLAGQSSVVTASIGAAQNNYSPTGFLTAGAMTANLLRITPTAIRVSLTGLAAPSSGTVDGAIVTIENAVNSGFPLRLYANSSSSSAANRFGFSSDLFLPPGESVFLQYDDSATIWRELNPHRDHSSDRWGSANDGSQTYSTSQSALSRTWYFDNLTLSSGGVLPLTGGDIYVNDTLDISGASAGAITFNGVIGTGGSSPGGGGAGAGSASFTNCPVWQQAGGGTGGNGSTTAGAAGGASVSRVVYNSANVGNSGAGGAGNSGAEAGGAGGANSPSPLQPTLEFRPPTVTAGANPIFAGMAGSGGGGGGGDTSNSGGGGGGGGSSGGGIRIFARNIYRGTNSTAAIIQAKAGAGANGGNATVGNAAGGGGGSGGCGGTVMVFYGAIYGSTITNAIDVSGGSGGNGGTAVGTGAAGAGGMAGPGGYVMTFNATTGAATTYTGNARVAASGATGGTATSSQTSL